MAKVLYKRMLTAWYKYRKKKWDFCYDEACFQKPDYRVYYETRIKYASPEIARHMSWDKVGTHGRFCTLHLELLKRRPGCEVGSTCPIHHDHQAA